jgi:uncharacterized protein (UPF0261 family)
VKDFPAERFGRRTLHRYNAEIVLMRVSAEESRTLGGLVARKLNAAAGPVEVLVPLRGFSLLDREDGPEISPHEGSPKTRWFDPEADGAFLKALETGLEGVPVRRVDAHINDPEFADVLVQRACDLIETAGRRSREP